MSTARPFRRAADRARMQRLQTVIDETRQLIDATPSAPAGDLNMALDAARAAAIERLWLLARNRPPNKSRKRP